MATDRKATFAKRQRELEQKDRVKERDARRADRKERSADRKAAGIVGPEMGTAAEMGNFADPGAFEAEGGAMPEIAVVAPRPPREKVDPGGRLYVGNLSYDTTAEDLKDLFSEVGPVTDVHLVMDRDTGRPRGFAFVTMTNSPDAAKAIEEMSGRSLDGRQLRVNEAEARASRPGGFSGGGRGRRF